MTKSWCDTHVAPASGLQAVLQRPCVFAMPFSGGSGMSTKSLPGVLKPRGRSCLHSASQGDASRPCKLFPNSRLRGFVMLSVDVVVVALPITVMQK